MSNLGDRPRMSKLQHAASSIEQAELDLFGSPTFVPKRRARRRNHAASRAEDDLFDLRLRCLDAFRRLSRSVDHAFEAFSLAMADFQTGDNAGEIDLLVDELREEIVEEIRGAGRRVWE